MANKKVTVIGAGLAGTEAAWQLANAGVPVQLFEMRPSISSPAHHSHILKNKVLTIHHVHRNKNNILTLIILIWFFLFF